MHPAKHFLVLLLSVLVVLIGTRANGVFLWLFILSWAINALSFFCGRRRVVSLFAQISPLLGLLTIYVFSLFISGFIDAGGNGLKESIALYMSIPLLFLSGCNIAYLSKSFSAVGMTWLLALLGLSMSFSAFAYGSLNKDLPLSSLRPSELIFSLGLLFMSCAIKVFRKYLKIPNARIHSWTNCLLVNSSAFLVLLALAGAFLFKGFSSCILLFLTFYVSASLLDRSQTKFASLVTAVVGAFAAYFLLSDIKFLAMKILVSPFAGADMLNGRVESYVSSLQSIALSSPDGGVRLIGSVSTRMSDTWAHNFLIDSLIHEGLLPTVFIVAFGMLYLRFLGPPCRSLMLQNMFAYFALFIVFSISMFQPVQYSDGSVFALSFFLLGILLGMFNDNTSSISPAFVRSFYIAD